METVNTETPPSGFPGRSIGDNRFWVRRDGHEVQPSSLPGKVSGFPLQPDDVLVMESSGGGGGFGDPLERDPARVAADVAEGYVTRSGAEAKYGVVVGEDGGVDAAATARRRVALASTRVPATLTPADDLESERGRSIRLTPTRRAG